MDFYLGTHDPRWLETSHVPLFVSMHRLAKYQRTGDPFPKARARWAMDSGGFTELRDHGTWTTDADTFGGMVYRFTEDCGRAPDFVAGQDWMCEPWVISGGIHKGIRYAGTGLTIRDHLELTVEGHCYLKQEFPHAPWAPVLQGWQLDDYLLCDELYRAAGVDLAAEPRVGLGSVCRREGTEEIGAIASVFASKGYRLHGFGVKRRGLERYGHLLASADSLAWSAGARWDKVRLPGCEHRGYCNNCRRWALQWRSETLAAMDRPAQLCLDLWAELAA
ncbi:DUF7221 family queuine tRNA-ribosyltransferase-like protein [Micromonospora echinospora]